MAREGWHGISDPLSSHSFNPSDYTVRRSCGISVTALPVLKGTENALLNIFWNWLTNGENWEDPKHTFYGFFATFPQTLIVLA